MARTLLGLASGLYLLSVALLPDLDAWGLAIRLGGLLAFEGTRRGLLQLRQRRLNDPCMSCPHGRKPFCAHYLPAWERLDAELVDGDAEQRRLVRSLASSIRDERPIAPADARAVA